LRKRHWSYQGEKNRAIVLRRGYCEIGMEGCTGRAETVDHIIPKILGGPDIIENLRAACWHCNMSKGKRMVAPPRPSWTGDPAQDVLRADGAAQRRGPFFSDAGYRRAPLLNTPPHARWTPLTAGDYRQLASDARRRP
jgi:HNH endonuclease